MFDGIKTNGLINTTNNRRSTVFLQRHNLADANLKEKFLSSNFTNSPEEDAEWKEAKPFEQHPGYRTSNLGHSMGCVTDCLYVLMIERS